jgi:hypothetical protein
MDGEGFLVVVQVSISIYQHGGGATRSNRQTNKENRTDCGAINQGCIFGWKEREVHNEPNSQGSLPMGIDKRKFGVRTRKCVSRKDTLTDRRSDVKYGRKWRKKKNTTSTSYVLGVLILLKYFYKGLRPLLQ